MEVAVQGRRESSSHFIIRRYAVKTIGLFLSARQVLPRAQAISLMVLRKRVNEKGEEQGANLSHQREGIAARQTSPAPRKRMAWPSATKCVVGATNITVARSACSRAGEYYREHLQGQQDQHGEHSELRH